MYNGFRIAALFKEKVWCNCLGTKYNTSDVSSMNHPKVLNRSGVLDAVAAAINPTAGMILIVISA